MIKKRVGRILDLSILILVRQTWKLICNLYHLLNQPFLTIKDLIKERDKSQIFLLAVTSLMPIIGYISARIVWDMHEYGFIVGSVGKIFAIVISIETLIFLYLGYWTFRAFKKN